MSEPTTARPDPLWILDLAQTRAAAVIAAVRPDQLHLPTQCDEWDVVTVIDKMVAATIMFTSFARREEPDPSLDLVNPRHIVGDDPLGAFLTVAADCRAAWRAEGALDGTAPSTIGEVPAKGVLHGRIFDTTIMSWDVARATGIPHGIDAIQATYVTRIARAVVPAVRSLDAARYKTSIDLGHDADPVDVMIAVTGRDPGWTPESST